MSYTTTELRDYSRSDTDAMLDWAAGEIDRLQTRASKELEEFNAGYDCAINGGSIDDEPVEGISEDHWGIGFKTGSFSRLQAIVDRCQRNADGDAVCVGDWQWVECDGEPIHEKVYELTSGTIRGVARWSLSQCHSTREAAEKARTT